MSEQPTKSSTSTEPTAAMRRGRSGGVQGTILARGEPMLWLSGSALVLCTAMIAILLGWVAMKGFSTFWPDPITRYTLADGTAAMGEVSRDEEFVATEGAEPERRRLLRTANFDLTGTHYEWYSDSQITAEDSPEWAVLVERLEWGRFYGFPRAYAELDALRRTTEDGAAISEAEVRAAADAIQERVGAEVSASTQWRRLIERRVDGKLREILVRPAELEPSDRVVAVARVVEGEKEAWAQFESLHGEVRELWHQARGMRKHDIGVVSERAEQARLRLREAELEHEPSVAWVAARRALHQARQEADADKIERTARRLKTLEEDLGPPPEAYRAAFDAFVAELAAVRKVTAEVTARIDEVEQGMRRHALRFESASGDEKVIRLSDIVIAYPANQVSWSERMGIYLERWWEYLFDEPRESNSEGGVFPAIFGTVLMTLLMCIIVVPFGVLAALYLREYAKAGPLISLIRIAINNLAGVPSIVFGVFGLGFFCYMVGATIDELLFEANLPSPTFGKSGMLWASLTLALMTLPVVIVATEEALAAVPSSVREGSFACGASKWQTIRRVVLPRAMPGIMTGAILAMARGAGEVAPLMLVGAVKLAPELPIDLAAPFGLDRSFMHLGFHIYDLGFQSPNSEAAKPMVYTTTLLLISIIAVLNIVAIWLRSRLRRRFVSTQF